MPNPTNDDTVIIAELVDQTDTKLPKVELAIIEPMPWLVNDLLQEALDSRDPMRVERAIGTIEKLYPHLAKPAGEYKHFTVEHLDDAYREKLRTPFWSTVEDQIETRFHQAVQHVNVPARQQLYYRGLPQ